MKESTKELGKVLRNRIRLLASLIARKPPQYTQEWAKAIDEAFTLYTNTRTVNFFHALNGSLIDLDWPFPAFIDLTEESQRCVKGFDALAGGSLSLEDVTVRKIGISNMTFIADFVTNKTRGGGLALFDAAMIGLFDEYRVAVFDHWINSPLLAPKAQIIHDIAQAYNHKLWAVCITATVPLLDHIVRDLFGSTRLNLSIQVLRDAFVKEAGLRPKDVMPGYAIWDEQRDPGTGNAFAKSLEEDLRLPGIFLSSFFEFADRYYEWYKNTGSSPRTPLNRHAIMHCSSEYWTQPNAVRLITFVDLTLRLERVLRILITGKDVKREGD